MTSCCLLQGLGEAIVSGVTHSLKQVMHEQFSNVFATSTLPSFERACQHMYQQVDEAFRRGTAECECMWICVRMCMPFVGACVSARSWSVATAKRPSPPANLLHYSHSSYFYRFFRHYFNSGSAAASAWCTHCPVSLLRLCLLSVTVSLTGCLYMYQHHAACSKPSMTWSPALHRNMQDVDLMKNLRSERYGTLCS